MKVPDSRFLYVPLQLAPAAPTPTGGNTAPPLIVGQPYLPGNPGGGGVGYQLQFLYEPDYISCIPGLVTVLGQQTYQQSSWGVRLYAERCQELQGIATPNVSGGVPYNITTQPICSFTMSQNPFEVPWIGRGRYVFVEFVTVSNSVPAAKSFLEITIAGRWIERKGI